MVVGALTFAKCWLHVTLAHLLFSATHEGVGQDAWDGLSELQIIKLS